VTSISPVRKAAIVLVSLEQSLASQILANLDRGAVEAVTWEIARLDRIDPDEQAAVLEEFLGLGLRRLCFGFEDLLRMDDRDIRGAFHREDLATWALALAGAAPPVRARVLGALDAESARALGRSLEGFGPFRLSDAEAAQSEIADRFRLLYDQGAISLPAPTGREEVLV
jgi:flagellar motor switch protein FliG